MCMIQLLRSTAILFLTVSSAFSQNTSTRYATTPLPPTNTERYNSDYLLKDYAFVNGDSTILEQIDLAAIEHLRSDSENIEVLDANTGLVVILFHQKSPSSISDTDKNTIPSNQ